MRLQQGPYDPYLLLFMPSVLSEWGQELWLAPNQLNIAKMMECHFHDDIRLKHILLRHSFPCCLWESKGPCWCGKELRLAPRWQQNCSTSTRRKWMLSTNTAPPTAEPRMRLQPWLTPWFQPCETYRGPNWASCTRLLIYKTCDKLIDIVETLLCSTR